MPWYDRGKGVNYSNPKKPGRFKRVMIDTKSLLEKYYTGKKLSEIAEFFNVSTATIKRHLKFIVPDYMKRNNGLTSNPNDILSVL